MDLASPPEQHPGLGAAARMNCPGCREAAEEMALVFWRAQRMPVLCHALCRTRAEALSIPRAPIELTLCRQCGLVYNRAFDPRRITYQSDYENALHFSPHFRQYADTLAARLIEAHGIRGGRVLEIGCGDGAFLERLCRLGDNQGLGLDPAYDPRRSPVPQDVDLRIIAEPFDPPIVRTFAPDLICCRHVLEHLDDPLSLLGSIRAALDDRRRAVVYFEVPNLLQTLERMAVWDLIYEHCLYLTPATLRRLFRTAGFRPIDSGEAYGGQFAWIEAAPGEGDLGEENGLLVQQCEDLALSFELWCSARLAQMRQWLAKLVRSQRQAVVWGAGSKAVTMLNVLEVSEQVVPAVVDQNPRKHGHHLVGTGQPIIAPDELPQLGPSAVIVMNPLYHEEIAEQLERMNLGAELVVA